MVFQAQSLFEHLTAIDNVTLALVHALGWTRERAEAEALGAARRRSAWRTARARIRDSSRAARRSAWRSRARSRPIRTLLLLDEPTSALDPARRGSLGEVLRALAAEGRALLISTHDVDFAEAFADRVAVLAEGVVVEEGSPREVLSELDARGHARAAPLAQRGAARLTAELTLYTPGVAP